MSVDEKKEKDNTPQKGKCVEVTGGSIDTCKSNPVSIAGISKGVIAKIPVVLAELTVQLNINSILELPEPALEIKRIKKHVKVTQCLLLQDTNMLFLKGFIRKNIEYATRNCSDSQGVCGDIRHCTIDVPFQCATSVAFNGTPPRHPISNTTQEFEYFKRQKLSGAEFAEKDELLSGDLSEFNQITTEHFNELPYCELINARIVEFDEFLNPKHPRDFKIPFEEKLFKRIEEKMVVHLTLKLLQNRQVVIPRVGEGEMISYEEE